MVVAVADHEDRVGRLVPLEGGFFCRGAARVDLVRMRSGQLIREFCLLDIEVCCDDKHGSFEREELERRSRIRPGSAEKPELQRLGLRNVEGIKLAEFFRQLHDHNVSLGTCLFHRCEILLPA